MLLESVFSVAIKCVPFLGWTLLIFLTVYVGVCLGGSTFLTYLYVALSDDLTTWGLTSAESGGSSSWVSAMVILTLILLMGVSSILMCPSYRLRMEGFNSWLLTLGKCSSSLTCSEYSHSLRASRNTVSQEMSPSNSECLRACVEFYSLSWGKTKMDQK